MVGGGLIFFAIVALIVLVAIMKTAVIVPQKTAYIVERLGRYRCTLDAGFHILIPFFDRVAYKHSLKEQAIDVPPQECITKDNIAVSVDGILYMQVMDPAKASYGIGNYLFATTQLAQTTMRSEMGSSTSTAASRSAPRSTPRLSPPSTRPAIRGVSRLRATRSRTSPRPSRSGTRWRSRCVPSAKSAP